MDRQRIKGILHIQPLKAQISRNTEFIGEMDPFVEMEFDNQVVVTDVCLGGGVTPFWLRCCKFNHYEGNLLRVRLFDHEMFKKKHDLVGEVVMDASKFLKVAGMNTTWVDVFYRGQKAAEIKLKYWYQSLIRPETQLLNEETENCFIPLRRKNTQKNNTNQIKSLNIADKEMVETASNEERTENIRPRLVPSQKCLQPDCGGILQQLSIKNHILNIKDSTIFKLKQPMMIPLQDSNCTKIEEVVGDGRSELDYNEDKAYWKQYSLRQMEELLN